MKEFLILVWRLKMFTHQVLRLTDGREIEIISCGIPAFDNADAPEFFRAGFRYLDDNVEMHGSIKIDVNSVDWYYQKTVASAQFDNVILHVVTNADATIMINNHIVPTLVLDIPEEILDYRQTISRECKTKFADVDKVYAENFIARLATDRIERKSKEVIEIYNSVEKSWARTTLIVIMRAFGYGETKATLEKLARNISIYFLCINITDIQTLEAMLFGYSGHLDKKLSIDPYYFDLQQRYEKLCKDYKLPTFSLSWHNSQVRPRSVAELQIARIAAVLHNNSALFEKLVSMRDYDKIRKMFSAQLSPYWQNHSSLGIESSVGINQMSSDKIDLIIINGVVPLLYAYGDATNDTNIQEWAMDILGQVNPEKNSKVKSFESEGFITSSALQTQALIQMYDVYCCKAKCDRCPLGSHLILNRYKLYKKVFGKD